MRVFSREQGQFIEVPDEQAGGFNMGQSGSSQSAAQQALLMSALQNLDPDNASTYTTLATLMKNLEEQQAPKEEDPKQVADRVLTQLEDMYFGSQRGSLAYGRIEGAKQRIEAARGNNPELSAYIQTRESIRPTLARALGDVGNLALPEQEAAVKGIPTGFNTPEEAALYFKSTRQKLGLPERDITKTYEVKPTNDLTQLVSTETDDTDGMGVQTPPLRGIQPLRQENVTSTSNQIPSMSPDQPAQQMPTDVLDVNIPNLPYGLIGGVGGRFLPLPPGIRAALGYGVGKTLSDINEEGIPLTREAKERLGYSTKPNWALFAGPLGPIISEALGGPGYSEKEKEMFKGAALAALLDLVSTPVKTLGGARQAVAKASNKTVSGEKIAQATTNYAQNVPATSQRSAQKYALDAIEKFSGKKISLPQALKEATAAQSKAFTLSGNPSRAVASQFENAVAQALRNEIAKQSPLTGYLTTGLSKTIQAQNALNSLFSKLGGVGLGVAGGAGAAYGLNRLGLFQQ